MTAVLSYRDVLSKSLIKSLHDFPKSQTSCRSNYTSWQKELVRASAAILVFDLSDELRQEVVKQAKHVCDELNKYQTIHALYHKMMPSSYITWHQDQSWKFGMTIHLNEYWDENFGGYFAYKDKEEIKCLKPEFNCANYIVTPLDHCVFETTPDAPPRTTIQLFGL
jgi:hypothetical protein